MRARAGAEATPRSGIEQGVELRLQRGKRGGDLALAAPGLAAQLLEFVRQVERGEDRDAIDGGHAVGAAHLAHAGVEQAGGGHQAVDLAAATPTVYSRSSRRTLTAWVVVLTCAAPATSGGRSWPRRGCAPARSWPAAGRAPRTPLRAAGAGSGSPRPAGAYARPARRSGPRAGAAGRARQGCPLPHDRQARRGGQGAAPAA